MKILLRFVSRLDILNIQRCCISYILFKLERIKRVRPFLSDYILLKLFGPEFRSHPFSLLLFKFIGNPYLYIKSLLFNCKHRSPGRWLQGKMRHPNMARQFIVSIFLLLSFNSFGHYIICDCCTYASLQNLQELTLLQTQMV